MRQVLLYVQKLSFGGDKAHTQHNTTQHNTTTQHRCTARVSTESGNHPVKLAYVRTNPAAYGWRSTSPRLCCAKYVRTCLFFPLYTQAATMRMILRSLAEHIGPTGIRGGFVTSCVGRILYLPSQKDSMSRRLEDDQSAAAINQTSITAEIYQIIMARTNSNGVLD